VPSPELLHITAQKSFREDESAKHKAHIRRLQELLQACQIQIAESRSKESSLNTRVLDLERTMKRMELMSSNSLNVEYLKNVVVKFMETGDETLVPVIGTVLHLTSSEVDAVKKKREGKKHTILPFL